MKILKNRHFSKIIRCQTKKSCQDTPQGIKLHKIRIAHISLFKNFSRIELRGYYTFVICLNSYRKRKSGICNSFQRNYDFRPIFGHRGFSERGHWRLLRRGSRALGLLKSFCSDLLWGHTSVVKPWPRLRGLQWPFSENPRCPIFVALFCDFGLKFSNYFWIYPRYPNVLPDFCFAYLSFLIGETKTYR